MAENDEISRDKSEYMSVQEAAKRLKVSDSRIYDYINKKRIGYERVGKVYIVLKKDIETFKRNPTGRLRKQPPNWRVYHDISEVFATEMRARIREGQQEKLVTKLNRMLDEQQHRLTGSIARYVVRDRDEPDLISVWLIWKNTELPDQEIHELQKQAFMDELADVLDWGHAEIREKEGIIYT
jgi:excisionase family DNA binding protein